jgi:hypothetical protein
VDRVCTDANLERTISDYSERFRGTLAIVITKIDEGITDDLADALQAKGEDIGSFDETKATIAKLKDQLKAVKRDLKSARLTPTAKCALRDREDSLLQSLHDAESERFESLVTARNNHIESRLQNDKKKHQLEDAQFPIHFVSNKQYDVHKQIDESEGPRLQIDTTGIPGLRSYILGLAAPGVWKSYEEHLMHDIKVVFHDVHGWALGEPGTRHKSLMECVNGVSSIWQAGKDACLERMNADFEIGVITCLRKAHDDSLQGAIRWYDTIISKPWWWHNRFLASFRNDGQLRNTVGAANWNESFIESQTKDVLNSAWEERLPPPDRYFNDAMKKLNYVIENLPDDLERQPSSVNLPMRNFVNILESQAAGIDAAHYKRKMHYQQELANIKLDATLDQHTGHFSQAMQPCYDEGKADKGKKVCTRIKTLLYNYLIQKDPLGMATESLSDALESNAHHHARLLDKDVQRILSDISQQFGMILERGTETQRERAARRQIGAFLNGHMEDVDRIEGDLASIRQNCPEL